MIVSFSVENFRSFHGEATLSLVANNRLAGEHGNHAVVVPGSSAKVLRPPSYTGPTELASPTCSRRSPTWRSLAVYRFGRETEGTLREPFRFSTAQHTPSAFDLQFIAKGKLFRYFIKLDDQQVLEEWLGETIGDRERAIFERGQDRDVVLGEKMTDNPRLAALATVGAPPDQSFLSTIAAAALSEADIGPDLVSVIVWFANVLTLIRPGEPQGSLCASSTMIPCSILLASSSARHQLAWIVWRS